MLHTAGLLAGTTEAVFVVTPMDVIKIRLQAQQHSMADPLDIPKYRNAAHAAYTIIKEEGISTLYQGVALTALRQATNQAVNFTVYQEMKKTMKRLQETKEGQELPTYQHLLMGGISGAMGKFILDFNNNNNNIIIHDLSFLTIDLFCYL